MTAEAGGIQDTRNTIGAPNFDGTDANWESWRVKFAACADLANMGAHLDVVAEQTSFITHDGLDANSVTISKSSRLAHPEVRRQSSISGFLGSLALWIGNMESARRRRA